MMKSFRHTSALFTLSAILLFTASCSKKNDSTPAFEEKNLAPLSIEFDNIVGDKTLNLNNTTTPYKNAAGETFSISKVQYFISNIQLSTTSGKNYIVNPDSSYFLIKGGDESGDVVKINVPEGDYNQLTFTLGVDSLRSTMPIEKRTGVLDPANGGGHDGGGMYWGWNSGYVFFKMEGNSSSISDDTQGDPTGKKQFRYHIGGFGGYSAPTINNIKVIKLDLTKAGIAKVRKDRKSNIHLFVDLLKVFNGPKSFSIAEHPQVMFSDFSVNVADNLATMFKHDHSEN